MSMYPKPSKATALDNEGRTREAHRVELPPRPFLYTLDQIATILAIEVSDLRQRIYFTGKTTSYRVPRQLVARNISPPTLAPEWRVAEEELVRYLKECGFRLHRQGLRF